ncbi:MAG: histidine--tRNA ligase [Spirochaetia bacterium]|nr:histidine--tRNA ligase [Spirochaetia bacterium]
MSNFLSTKPYKGARDFFPADMRLRDWMFSVAEKTVESFGFEKIDAPLIEPIEIYLAKTSEEIVNKQIYSFEDRGERKVAIRPEMTPTVSRMVAAKSRELPRPIRWYSIPNVWRYEKPGKGRLREHWQLNADIFGAADEFLADVEILQMALEILINLGAKPEHFKLRLNQRNLLNEVFEKKLNLDRGAWQSTARILDKKDKIPEEEYRGMLSENGLNEAQINELTRYFEDGFQYLEKNKDVLSNESAGYLFKLSDFLKSLGYGDYIEYNPSVIRGFDYYTGIVFEIFDTHPENRRSLYGGGRYDNLVSSFIKENLNAVGFGMGDVTLKDFLETHNLIPPDLTKTQVYIASFAEDHLQESAFKLAALLRKNGFSTEVTLGQSKLGKQFQEADAKKIPLVIVQGSDEKEKSTVTVKKMTTGDQETVLESRLIEYLKSNL